MPSTFTCLNFHFIFGTKSCIAPAWRRRLHEYLGGTAKALGCVPLAVGGVDDHVHALLSLRATHAPADIMRELKKACSVMVHREIELRSFAWQEGYAAIAVSPEGLAKVKQYVDSQEEHHRHISFDDELEEIFRDTGIPFTRGTDMR